MYRTVYAAGSEAVWKEVNTKFCALLKQKRKFIDGKMARNTKTRN